MLIWKKFWFFHVYFVSFWGDFWSVRPACFKVQPGPVPWPALAGRISSDNSHSRKFTQLLIITFIHSLHSASGFSFFWYSKKNSLFSNKSSHRPFSKHTKTTSSRRAFLFKLKISVKEMDSSCIFNWTQISGIELNWVLKIYIHLFKKLFFPNLLLFIKIRG